MMDQSMKEKKRTDSQTGSRDAAEDPSRVVSFDAYFRRLVATSKAQEHHKAPMRRFAEQRGATDATEQQFDEIFRSY